MVTDHHFPRYHVRPRTGYVNDPNGPVFFDGAWHLFFQYVYDTPRTGPVVWGHATGADLAGWELHRPAISPHPQGADRNGCWSGNTVARGGEITAFYSGSRAGHPYQSIVAAISTDGGESFGPPHQIVADPAPAEKVVSFRDPFVFGDGDRWLMLVGAGDAAGNGLARIYESTDLRNWDYRGRFAELPGTRSETWGSGEMWECPQLVSDGGRDALLVATFDSRRELMGVIALCGRRAEFRLNTQLIERLDQGANFYAPSVLRESRFGPLVWGWATEGRSTEWTVDADWSGMITIPRTIKITDESRVACAPAPPLEKLRDHALRPSRPAAYTDLPAQFEFRLDLSDHRDTEPTRISLHSGPTEHFDITVDWRSEQVIVDRNGASSDPRAHGGCYAFTEPGIGSSGALSLRWYVDGSISELFTGSGRTSTVRFYPTTPPPWTVTIDGSRATDVVDAWTLAAG